MNRDFASDIGIFFLKQLALLPFRLLYFFSDLLYYLIYYIIGYRKKVVIENLKNSFPEKSDPEIRTVAKRFYRHFCDLTVEVIKLHAMNEKDFRQRLKVKNIGLLDQLYKQNRSIVVLTMHYNNWEWSSCIPLYLKHMPLGVYKPLHNRKYDAYINNNRDRMGVNMIPTHMVLRRIVELQRQHELFLLWLAGDQTPPVFHDSWFTFLNQEAMFYPGPAALSGRFNLPVLFQKIEKVKRGHYETTFELLIENPSGMSETEIMDAYIRRMEEVIRAQPEFYLWSHKRWKHKRPEHIRIQGKENITSKPENA
jgi:Kdo2-lipid IVA lauroyltransferase/acyltransferase